MNIKTRKEAIASGDKKYFTGKPCKQGHLVLRRTTTGQCVECERIRQLSDTRREYNRKIINTQKYKDQRKKYRETIYNTQRYKQWTKTTHLKRTYGLSLEQYDLMCQFQNNCCTICKTTLDDTKCVDHCHNTGVIRSILCPNCNKLLGLAKESTEILTNAIVYLQYHHTNR